MQVHNCTAAGQPSCRADDGSSVGPCCTTGPNHADDVGDDAPVIVATPAEQSRRPLFALLLIAQSVDTASSQPVQVDSVLGTVRFQPTFYYIGHFSRFLPPGSTRIRAELRQSEEDRRQRCAPVRASPALSVSVWLVLTLCLCLRLCLRLPLPLPLPLPLRLPAPAL